MRARVGGWSGWGLRGGGGFGRRRGGLRGCWGCWGCIGSWGIDRRIGVPVAVEMFYCLSCYLMVALENMDGVESVCVKRSACWWFM